MKTRSFAAQVFGECPDGNVPIIPIRRLARIKPKLHANATGYQPNTNSDRKRQARATAATDLGLGIRVRQTPRKKAFWQIAPDGKTIERLYDPMDEPIDIEKEEK